MDLDWLDDFLTLAISQNFSRAAELRHVTQPAFSRRIQMLEKWVGTPLFQRFPRRIVLTSAGEQFHAAIEAVPRTLHQARADALEAAGRSGRSLAIAATHALSFTFFPQWARQTLDPANLGALNLLSDNMATCEDMMLRGEAQFLLCHRHDANVIRLPSRQFRHVRVGQDVLVPCVAPREDGTPLWTVDPFGRSAAVPFLAYAPQSGLGRILKADWKTRGLDPHLETIMSARLAAALLTLAEDRRGVAWLPLSLAADRIKLGKLVRASSQADLVTPIDIVVYRPAARLGQAAEALWSAIMKQGEQPPDWQTQPSPASRE